MSASAEAGRLPANGHVLAAVLRFLRFPKKPKTVIDGDFRFLLHSPPSLDRGANAPCHAALHTIQMNTPACTSFVKSPHSRGFTLIELLVVITIIGILVGIAVPVGNKVLENTRKVRVQATIKDLQVAIKGYQTEYTRYPVKQAGGQDATLMTDDSNSLVSLLLGENKEDLNPREIVFIELPMAKNNAGGLVGDEGAYALNDGWGEPYTVVLDTDYDNRIENPDVSNEDSKISGEAPARLPMGVAISSKGKDKKESTKDDVVSWR